jgi:hypothetical protein
VIPPEANASFVAAMEDVLETYQRPRDADRPLVCLDETSKQLIAETRAAIAAKPDGLKSFEAGPALGDMPTRQLGVPVLGDADQWMAASNASSPTLGLGPRRAEGDAGPTAPSCGGRAA